MKLLFLDLETTGLPIVIKYGKYYPYSQLQYYDSSRIVQLALLVYETKECDSNTSSKIDNSNTNDSNMSNIANVYNKPYNNPANYVLTKEYNYIIKPDGYKIENEKLHGISHDMANFVGIPFVDVVKLIKQDLMTGDLLVAHNLVFDKNILLSELYRYKLLDECKIIESLSTFCTSIQCTNITKIRRYKHKYKQPKLTELYRFLFNADIINLHDALFDTRAMVKIFFELMQRKLIMLE